MNVRPIQYLLGGHCSSSAPTNAQGTLCSGEMRKIDLGNNITINAPGWTLSNEKDAQGKPKIICESNDPALLAQKYTYPATVQGPYKNLCTNCLVKGNTLTGICWSKHDKKWKNRAIRGLEALRRM